MRQVFTTKGLVDRDRLAMRPVITESQHSVEVALEWTLGDELVRRDLWVNLLQHPQMQAASGKGE